MKTTGVRSLKGNVQPLPMFIRRSEPNHTSSSTTNLSIQEPQSGPSKTHTHTKEWRQRSSLVSSLRDVCVTHTHSLSHTHRNKLYAAEKERGHTADTHQDTHTSRLHCACVGPSVCVRAWRGAQISTEWLLLRVCRQKTRSPHRAAVSASGHPLAKNSAAAFSDEDER